MFDSFRREQPAVPDDVSFYLESERGRLLHELQGGQTTEDRGLLDPALAETRAAAERIIDNPTDEVIDSALDQAAVAQAAMVITSVRENTLDVAMHLMTPREERDIDEAFIDKSAALGSLIMHGLKVERWARRHRGEPLNADNVVAGTVAGTLLEAMGGRGEVKRLGRVFGSFKTYNA